MNKLNIEDEIQKIEEEIIVLNTRLLSVKNYQKEQKEKRLK